MALEKELVNKIEKSNHTSPVFSSSAWRPVVVVVLGVVMYVGGVAGG